MTSPKLNLAHRHAPLHQLPTCCLQAGLRSRLDSGLAAWRWSPFGQSSVVPLPPPPLSDPRMALTALVFAKVLLDEAQVCSHRGLMCA